MAQDARLTPRLNWLHGIISLGVSHILIGLCWAALQLSTVGGTNLITTTVLTALIVVPGTALCLGGYYISNTNIRPKFYHVVGKWCFASVGGMVLILGLYESLPNTSITTPMQSVSGLTALSGVAGLGIGLYGAKAKSNLHRLKQKNRELQRTQQHLQESNERLEQFAYAASHDLQEPLRMVTSYLDLIEQRYGEEFNSECEEFLSYAMDGAERMHTMIDALLDYSRLETRGEPFQEVDLNTVLSEACDDLEVKIDETNATLNSETLPIVEGDPNQLRQVFQNLISNALEYTDETCPRVTIAAEQNGDEWIISVSDNGIGISPDEQDVIFEAFQRLHSHEEYTGTGLGLAMCKRIVERHNGEIWVDSEPGDGATFFISLPESAEPPSQETKPQVDGIEPSQT